MNVSQLHVWFPIFCVCLYDHTFNLLLSIQDENAGAIKHKENEGCDRNEAFGILNSLKVAISCMIFFVYTKAYN